MPRWTPSKRREFVRKLKALGFSPPEPGGRHWYARHGSFTLALPSNPEYSVPQLRMLLREVEDGLKIKISLERWTSL